MSRLTVTTKGQVTLRQELLRHLGVHPGEEIAVEKLPNGRIEIKAAEPTVEISAVFNALKKFGGVPLSLEEMERIAAEAWAGKR